MNKVLLSIVFSIIFFIIEPTVLMAQGVGYHALRNFIPSEVMSFFVTSEPIGNGGNLGGLEGADAHCQRLEQVIAPGGLISAHRRDPGNPLSMHVTGLGMVRGTTLEDYFADL